MARLSTGDYLCVGTGPLSAKSIFTIAARQQSSITVKWREAGVI